MGASPPFVFSTIRPYKGMEQQKQQILKLTDNSHYEHEYDRDENFVQLQWGKYDYGVDKKYQQPDHEMLIKACRKFNAENENHIAVAEYGDKYNYITIYTLKGISENSSLYERVIRNNKKLSAKMKSLGLFNEKIDNKIAAEIAENKAREKAAKALTKKLGFNVSMEVLKGCLSYHGSLHYTQSIVLKDKERKQIGFDSVGAMLSSIQDSNEFVDYLVGHNQYSYLSKEALIYMPKDYISVRYQDKKKELYIGSVLFQLKDSADIRKDIKTAVGNYFKVLLEVIELIKNKKLSPIRFF